MQCLCASVIALTVLIAAASGQRETVLPGLQRPSCLPGKTLFSAANSCRDILRCYPSSTSGEYYVRFWQQRQYVVRKVYCSMERTHCGIKGGWMRVAHLDTKEMAGCPEPLTQVNASNAKTLCTRSTETGCSSVLYRSHGYPYSRICGKAKGYSFGSPDAFARVPKNPNGIDHAYADGLSITHGSPRKMLWTYTAGLSENGWGDPYHSCPCSAKGMPAPPAFIGGDYICESAVKGKSERKWYLDDALWDGEGCPVGNNCCAKSGLPWFCQTLPVESTDNIEVRLCLDEPPEEEDIGIEELELFLY